MGKRQLFAALLCVVVLSGCESEQTRAERERQRAAHKAKEARECALVKEAIDLARSSGWSDYYPEQTGCRTYDMEECDIKVELVMAAEAAERLVLAQALEKIGKEDCGAEHRFAQKYGIAAFRDHLKLVKRVADRAADAEAAVEWDRDTRWGR